MGIVLFKNKITCCGCGACASICPKGAISMKPDNQGFIYPVIDSNLCVSCGACKKVCAYQNESSLHKPVQAYAAVNKAKEQLEKSASGGILLLSQHISWRIMGRCLVQHLTLRMNIR